MKKFIVYEHKNKINNKRYIGITCQEPKKRWRKGKGYKNSIFRKAIDKYGWENFEHTILFENLTKDEAEQKEIELIKIYKTMNKKYGYNMCIGGNVTTGYKHSNDAKKRMSIAKKNKYNGKNNPMYGRKGILSPAYNKKLSLETKKKISNSKKGILTNYAQTLCKQINQYDLNNNFIKKWDSIANIERELNISGSLISRVCRGKRKTTKGYIFKYSE